MRGVDCGNDDVLLDGSLKRPDTGALLARFVEDYVHQVAFRFRGSIFEKSAMWISIR